MTHDLEQAEELQRVTIRIGKAILEFWVRAGDFYAFELQAYILHRCGNVAPASADRVLRELRKQGRLNYVVLNRRKSLYRAVKPVTQMNLL